MANAAFSTTIKASKAASSALTGEACSGSGTAWQVTDTAKRILDPATAVVVYDNGTPVASTGYTLNYLFGTITFGSSKTGPITLDGAYFSTVDVAEAYDFSLSFKAETPESTVFRTDSDSGYKTRTPTLKDFTGEVKTYTSLQADLDSGGGEVKIASLLNSGTAVLIEVTFGGVSTEKFRGWALITSTDSSGNVPGLLENGFKFESAPQAVGASFGFGL